MAQNIDPTELSAALQGADLPASKEELIQQARTNDADPEIMTFLEKIEPGNYESLTEVQAELGKMESGIPDAQTALDDDELAA